MIMKILMAARPAYTQSGHLSLNDDSFFFLMFSNIFISSEQETDKFSTSSASTPPLHSSSSLCLSVWDRLQDLNWISHCAHSHSGLPTHPCAHQLTPVLTHPYLSSHVHIWIHPLTAGLTSRLTHSHPGSSIHTQSHLFTPMLTHSHQGSSAHTRAHFSSKVIGQRIKHEMQARVLLCTMPGPPITANPASGVCNPTVFFPRLSQVASRWGAGDTQHHGLSMLIMFSVTNSLKGQGDIRSRWEPEF